MSKDIKKNDDLSSILSPEQMEQLKNLEAEEDIEISSHRKLTGSLKIAITVWAVLTSLAHIYLLRVPTLDTTLFRVLHLASLGVLGFLLVPGWGKNKQKIHWSDWLGAVATIYVFFYFFTNYHELIRRMRVRPTDMDVLISIVLVIIVLELARRCSGNALLILSGVFLGYSLFGQYLPGLIGHTGYHYKRFFGYIASDYGIFSAPIAISSRYIILFIIFSAFLTVSGVGKYFVEWAFSVSGHARGGPAKVAVIASALMGTMNGTSAGNAVATGSLTIPLMKKVGYSSTFAAATEAVASAGGQVMPPIMGAGIFIMAEITGIPYQRIMFAGIIPAILYFFSCFMMVDYEAVKLNLLGFPRSALPSFIGTMKRGYLFIPVLILFYRLMSGYSVIDAGMQGILWSFIISWVHALVQRNVGFGMGVKKLVAAFEQGARGSIQLMAVCAAAGIVMGVIAQTGIGIKFANLLLGIAGTSQFLALVFAMGVSILLGMGMPTTAAYAIAASVLAPGLVRMGLPMLVAHMFVFYYACVSAITPPVALASYAASGISGSDPMKTGYMSFRLGITAYIVPFMFYYAPSIILGNQPDVMQILLADGTIGTVAIGTVVLRSVTAMMGVYALASAVQGWYFGRAQKWLQAVLLLTSFLLVSPMEWADGAGLIILVVLAVMQKKDAKQETPKTASA